MPDDGGGDGTAARGVASDTFIAELEARMRGGAGDACDPCPASGSAGRCELAWDEEVDVDVAAALVLEAYRAQGDAVPVTSGYIDLKGNAWAAIVWDGRTWVDIVTVSAASVEDGGEGARSCVKVVRLSA